jgi:beta-glucosidase
VLELWAGHAKAGSPLDYFTLASDASRAEAQAANYTRVAALARVMLQQDNPGNPNPMVQAALAADLVVVVAALTSDEGTDRDPSLALAPVDDAMIAAVTAAQPNTVVVLNAPGALVMPWADAAGAILCNWYAGQEEGNALADVLWGALCGKRERARALVVAVTPSPPHPSLLSSPSFPLGDVNPSGRTTVTFPMNANDTALSTPQQWPGVNGEVTYSEQLEVGYRWFDAHNVTPRFAFGHGLSYTSFEYSNIAIDTTSGAPSVLVNFTVRNAGARDGKEVAQLYVGYPPSAGEPPKLLRDFAVVHLAAGESAAVTLTLTPRDLMVWDGAWASVSGPFSAFVGASNRDLRLQGEFSLR